MHRYLVDAERVPNQVTLDHQLTRAGRILRGREHHPLTTYRSKLPQTNAMTFSIAQRAFTLDFEQVYAYQAMIPMH